MSSPWITKSGIQKNSTSPAVDDLYQSPNVFVNGVPVVLYATPGTVLASGGFSGVSPNAPVSINAQANAANSATMASYVSNPAAFNNATAAANGVKQDFPGSLESVSDTPGLVDASTVNGSAGIVSFLTGILNEAKNGLWRESGQGGKPSNPNIINIWKTLGFPSSAYWQTDQTPWCMGFVNFTLKSCGYKYCQEAGARAIAANPGRWNAKQVDIGSAQPGDIVLWTFGHVNFVYTANAGKLTFVGGNQAPTAVANRNPDDGDVTISWPSGWTAARGQIAGIYRPSQS